MIFRSKPFGGAILRMKLPIFTPKLSSHSFFCINRYIGQINTPTKIACNMNDPIPNIIAIINPINEPAIRVIAKNLPVKVNNTSISFFTCESGDNPMSNISILEYNFPLTEFYTSNLDTLDLTESIFEYVIRKRHKRPHYFCCFNGTFKNHRTILFYNLLKLSFPSQLFVSEHFLKRICFSTCLLFRLFSDLNL